MKKLDKYIQKSNFVKVFISDRKGRELRHFEGVVFSYTDDFVFMCDLCDFNYDGLVVLRKSDITKVRHSEHEEFFEKILKSENIIRNIRLQKRENPFRVNTMKRMLEQLEELKLPVIFECLYGAEETFQIGPIQRIDIDKIYIKYFNSKGEFDNELLEIDFNEITYLRFDSPYANMFYKYTDKIVDYGTNLPVEMMKEEEAVSEEQPKKKSKMKEEKIETADFNEAEIEMEENLEPKKVKKVKKIKKSKKVEKVEKVKRDKKIKKAKKNTSESHEVLPKKAKKEDKKVKEKSKKSKKEEDKKSKKDKASKKEKKSKKDKKSKKSKDSKNKDKKAKSSKKNKKDGKKGKKSKKK